MRWCQDNGLLKSKGQLLCPKPTPYGICNKALTMVKYAHNKCGYRWICARHKNYTRTVRSDSFFENGHLTLRQYLWMIYYWCTDTNLLNAMYMAGISGKETGVDLYKQMRDLIKEYFLDYPAVLGGPGHVVMCDESIFSRRKYNRGRVPRDYWVFGMYDVNQHIGWVEPVPNRSAEALMPLIQAHVAPGSNIWTDAWRAYRRISQLDVTPPYTHEVVVHETNFVDPNTGVHTQAVEAYWGRLKKRLKRKNVVGNKDLLIEHLREEMWRERFGDSDYDRIWDSFLVLIRLRHPM